MSIGIQTNVIFQIEGTHNYLPDSFLPFPSDLHSFSTRAGIVLSSMVDYARIHLGNYWCQETIIRIKMKNVRQAPSKNGG